MPAHHPPHHLLEHTWYIITAATVNHVPFLASDQAKEFLREKLRTLVGQFNLSLRAWVILDNHYHLLLRTDQGGDLTRFLGQLHGSSSRQINLRDQVKGRQVWHNYWDTGIRSERDMWTHFNYIHQNPVKHGYVRQLADWPFSSYHYYLRVKGEAWLADCWERYPVIDFLAGDDFNHRRTG